MVLKLIMGIVLFVLCISSAKGQAARKPVHGANITKATATAEDVLARSMNLLRQSGVVVPVVIDSPPPHVVAEVTEISAQEARKEVIRLWRENCRQLDALFARSA